MNGPDCLSDDSAVAPVISTILLVAITVILAAVIATFALGFTDDTETAPQGAFSAEQIEKHLNASLGNEADFLALRITYDGGKTIDKDRLRVRVNGEKGWGVVQDQRVPGRSNCNVKCHRAVTLWDGPGSIEAGDRITVVHKDDSNVSELESYSIQPNNEDDPAVSKLYPNSARSGPASRIDLDPGDTVQIVWKSKTGDDTAILFQQEIKETA